MESENDLFSYPIGILRQLLKLLMEDRDFLISMKSKLKGDLFANKYHRHIYEKLEKFFENFKDVPDKENFKFEILKITDTNSLTDIDLLETEFNEILKTEVKNVDWLKEEINSVLKEHYIRKSIEKTIELSNKKSYDAIPGIWRDLLTIQSQSDSVWLLEDAYEWQKTVELEEPIECSIKSITNALDGGYRAGELTVYMAKTNVGKSIQLVREAYHACVKQGKNVFFATCEMAAHKIAKRLTSAITKTSWKDIQRTNSIKSIGDGLINLKKEKNADILIKKYKPSELTGSRLLGDILEQQTVRNVKFDIIMIDYIDEMSPNEGKTSSDYTDQRFVCQEVISTSEELKIPIVSATQATRGGGKEKMKEGHMVDKLLDAEDVGDSYWVSRLAHILITMNQTKEQKISGRIDYYIAKNRDGEKGQVIEAVMEPSKMIIEEAKRPKNQTLLNIQNSTIGGTKDEASNNS